MTLRVRTLRPATVRSSVRGTLRGSYLPGISPANAILARSGQPIRDRAGNIILSRG